MLLQIWLQILHGKGPLADSRDPAAAAAAPKVAQAQADHSHRGSQSRNRSRRTMQALIASGLHLNIAAFLEGDGLAFRSFCTYGSRELYGLWKAAKQASDEPKTETHLDVFLLLYIRYRSKLFDKLVRRVIETVRVSGSKLSLLSDSAGQRDAQPCLHLTESVLCLNFR